MTFWPYHQIFTRIPSGDDMMKGQSTFVVEISELRNILKRCDSNSLVIGDELASGTESISALSIVSAGIVRLLDAKSSFIFATHLHDICKIKRITNMSDLRICHLAVNYDGEKLIYDRILKEGPGSTIYGLEVCKALGLPVPFMNLANEIRHEIIGNDSNICSIKKSKYNRELYIDKCKICNKNASEVHHIKQQILADENGYIDHVHKNKLENLMNICDECHHDVHRGNIVIDGYKQTSYGIELIYQRVEKNKKHNI
jgi:DNA mismatch repair protein MutS